MSDISNIYSSNFSDLHSVNRPPAPDMSPSSTRIVYSTDMAVDSVEISPRATALAGAAEASSLRVARTNAIRAQIENGTFETPERIEGTITQLLDIIG